MNRIDKIIRRRIKALIGSHMEFEDNQADARFFPQTVISEDERQKKMFGIAGCSINKYGAPTDQQGAVCRICRRPFSVSARVIVFRAREDSFGEFETVFICGNWDLCNAKRDELKAKSAAAEKELKDIENRRVQKLEQWILPS